MKHQKSLCVLLSVVLLGAVAVCGVRAAVDVSAPERAHVCFNDEGTLKILQISDIQDDAAFPAVGRALLRTSVEKIAPDLIILTGDNIAGYSCKTKLLAKSAIKQYMDIFESLGVPVAMVFGNHDDDDTPYTKAEQIEQYMSYRCFVGCAGVEATKTVGDKTTTNLGTYNIPVFASKDSDEIVYNIWCVDSGNYNPDPAYGGYGYVLPEQLAWYVEKSNELKEANGGEPVPSIAFQHIVPPQIFDALTEVEAGAEGAVEYGGRYYMLPESVDRNTNWMAETPCPPNYGFAEGFNEVNTMLAQGDVKAVFFGHDHINSYVVPYHGIDLVSSPGFTFQSYNDDHRGVRTITISKDDLSTYSTETFTAYELFEGDNYGSFLLKAYNFFDKIADFFENLWNSIRDVFKK
ncbi:MAG: metallophosphoesterase [Clostridia bacterium]|nr:metallophosphoesterase [Clostridia bacterium]